MSLTIRDIVPGDELPWRDLWAEYLADSNLTLPGEVTDSSWARLIDPASPMKGRAICENGRMLGFALYIHHPNSWVAGDDCYLGDIFVTRAARGRGLATRLMEDLAELARARGWHRMYWHTHRDNAPARRVYDRFAKADSHVRYQWKL